MSSYVRFCRHMYLCVSVSTYTYLCVSLCISWYVFVSLSVAVYTRMLTLPSNIWNDSICITDREVKMSPIADSIDQGHIYRKKTIKKIFNQKSILCFFFLSWNFPTHIFYLLSNSFFIQDWVVFFSFFFFPFYFYFIFSMFFFIFFQNFFLFIFSVFFLFFLCFNLFRCFFYNFLFYFFNFFS